MSSSAEPLFSSRSSARVSIPAMDRYYIDRHLMVNRRSLAALGLLESSEALARIIHEHTADHEARSRRKPLEQAAQTSDGKPSRRQKSAGGTVRSSGATKASSASDTGDKPGGRSPPPFSADCERTVADGTQRRPLRRRVRLASCCVNGGCGEPALGCLAP